jgi:hypothetical protein
MAWTAPMTAVSGSVFTAAQFNQFVRDNLNETGPAKAATAGGYFAVDGANSVAERNAVGLLDSGSGTTTSTSFTDLDGPALAGPAVTVTTGVAAVVVVHGTMSNSGTGSARMAYDISGASSVAAADNRGIGIFGVAGTGLVAGTTVLHMSGSLTPGVNTFTAKYRVSSGTGTFSSRRIAVFPL